MLKVFLRGIEKRISIPYFYIEFTNLLGYANHMEKKKPNYLLSDVLAIVADRGADAFTETALHGAWDLGLTLMAQLR